MIPVNRPIIQNDDINFLSKTLKEGWVGSVGPYINKFEKNFCKKFNFKYGIAVSSGTAALDIAVECFDFKENDEILVPSFTIVSTINQIIRKKLNPVFIDVDLKNWNMLDNIESLITKKTKAIIITHIYGLSPNVDKLTQIAKRYKLKIIEDAAESLGQKFNNNYCGCFGDISIFSFYSNKNITTGEGGFLVMKNKFYYEKAQMLKNLYFSKNRFVHKNIGWNYRMTSMQAALGLSQLKKLSYFLRRRLEIANIYNKAFKNYSNLFQIPPKKTIGCKNSYWVYGILINSKLKIKAKKLISIMKLNNIECRPFFYPLNLQPFLNKNNHTKNDCPNSYYLYQYGLYLPSGVGNTDNEIKYCAKTLIKILSNYCDK